MYNIDLKENAVYNACPARKIPHAITEDVKAELDKMVKMGAIEPIKEPTSVVSPMIIVKKNSKLRICIDPSTLNKNLLRCQYPLKTIDEIAAGINGSKLDRNIRLQ